MQTLVARHAAISRKELRRRLSETERMLERLNREKRRLEAQLAEAPRGVESSAGVACPSCGRDHDFLTDNGGYLGHVLEDGDDTEVLEPGKPLYCPGCGDVFLYAPAAPTA